MSGASVVRLTIRLTYRSPNPQSNRHFLRVDDSLPSGYTSSWAKFGRVTIAEGMSDIDTFVGAQAPFTPAAPTRNEVPTGSGTTMYVGWFKWYYARNSYNENSGDNGNWARSWVLVGDDRALLAHRLTDACLSPIRLIVQHPLRQSHRVFDAHAPMAEITPRTVKQTGGGRVMQVDVLIVGQHERGGWRNGRHGAPVRPGSRTANG